MLKIRKITVTNENIQKCNLLHYALNHFFRVFQNVNPKIKKTHIKTLCNFRKCKVKCEN